MTLMETLSRLSETHTLAEDPSSDRALPATLAAIVEKLPSTRARTPGQPSIGKFPHLDQAACKGADLDVFYEANGRAPKIRATTCAECPLQKDCMVWALRNEAHGLWGLTAGERAALGGLAYHRPNRTATEAARAAINAGIDPDNLADALIEVHALSSPAAGMDRRRDQAA